MKTLLTSLGFNADESDDNLYHRYAENGNCDTIRYMPSDDLYNAYLSIGDFEFVNETELIKILSK